jgi:site-specific DNA recombinase
VNGWRIPALEIESKLAAALSGILCDSAAIVRDLNRELDAAEVRSILETAAQWSKRLLAQEECGNALASLIDRVELAKGEARLSIRVPLEERSESSAVKVKSLDLQRVVPLEIRRRGIEMRLIIGKGADAKFDSALLKSVARANSWLLELLKGRSSSLLEISKREGVGKRYVSRIIRLAFLAPSVIEAIACGQQPPEMTSQSLSTRAGDFPLSWWAQRELLGFESASPR